MAYTVSQIANWNAGNQRVRHLRVTADAATQVIETGLGVIEAFSIGIITCTTGGFHTAFNSNASGVQSYGVLGFSGCASADSFFVTVFGR